MFTDCKILMLTYYSGILPIELRFISFVNELLRQLANPVVENLSANWRTCDPA